MNITAIGEILLDVFPSYRKVGGAPFNFIYHINSILGKANFISSVGNDDDGYYLRVFLEENGISRKYVQVNEKKPTGMVKVKLDDKGVPDFQILEDRAYDNIELTPEILDLVKNETDVLYFGTLAQRHVKSRETITALFDKDKKFFLDVNLRQNYYTKEVLNKSMKTANLVKLNEEELEIIAGMFIEGDFVLDDSAKKVCKHFNLDLLCITLGKNGSILITGDDFSKHAEHADNVVDTVGAGDAYASILCLGFMHNWSLEKINKYASKFAAYICTIKGALPDDTQIYEEYRGLLEDEQ